MDNSPDNNITAGREILLDLINLASDYCYTMTVDEDGCPCHEWETGSLEMITGYSGAEIKKRGGYAALIHPLDVGPAQERINELLKGNPVTGTLRIICSDGSVKYIEEQGLAEMDPVTGRAIRLLGVVREVTTGMSRLEKVTSLSDDFKFIAELNEEFNNCSDLPSLGKHLSDSLCSRYGFDGSTFYLLNQDGTRLVAQNMSLKGGAIRMVEKIIGSKLPPVEIDINNSKYYRDCLFNKEPLLYTNREEIINIASEFASSPALRKVVSPIMEMLNIKSVLLIPLWVNKAPSGLIDLSCSGSVDIGYVKRIESISGFLASSFSRRISEIQLAEKEEHYRLLLENAGAGIGYYDTKGNLLMLNSMAAAHLSTTPDQLTGKNILNLFPGKEGRRYLSRIKEAIEAGGHLEFEDRVALPGGDKWFISSFNRIASGSGAVSGIQIISTDITAAKQAELSAQESEERYRNLYDMAPYGIVTLDIDGTITSVNNSFVKISGYAREEIVGLHFTDTPALEKNKKTFFKKIFLGFIKSRSVNNIQFEWIHSCGEKRMGEASVKIIRTNANSIEVLAMVSDITKRTESEKQLRKREEELRIVNSTLTAAQKMANVGYWRYNVKAEQPEWSEQMFHIFGLNPKGPVPVYNDHKRIIHPDDWGMFDKAVSMCIEKGRRYNIVLRIMHPGGKYHYIHTQGFPAMQKNGKITELFGTSQDITEIKEAELALKESENRLLALSDASSQAIFFYDSDGKCIDCNSAAQRMFGYSYDELTGNFGPSLISDEYSERLYKKMRGDNESTFEALARKKDGSAFWALISSRRYTYHGKQVRVTTVLDIETRKRAEQRLVRSEKKYRTLFTNMAQGAFYQKADGTLIDINRAGLKMFGLTRTEVLGRNPKDNSWKVIDERGRELNPEQHPSMEAALTGKPVKNRLVGVYNPVRRDFVWMYVNAKPEFIKGSSVISEVFVTLHDVTDQKKYEEALLKSQEQLRKRNSFIEAVLDNLPIGLAVNSIDQGVASYHNKMFSTIYGWSEKEIGDIQSFFDKVYPDPDYRKKIYDMTMSGIASGDPAKMEWDDIKITRSDGSGAIVFARNIPIYDQNLMISTVQDVTSKKEAERELLNSYNQIKILSQHIETARESERKNIARELHDELGQVLTALKMDLGWIEGRIPDTLAELKTKSRTAIELVQLGIRNVQRLSSELRPSMLDNLGLIPSMEWYLAEFEDRSGIKTYFNFSGKDINFPDNVAIALYRVVQEALTNIYRHSGAGIARVNISCEADDCLRLEISDNGSGIPKEKITAHDSFGLMGMMERIGFINGSIEIKSRKGRGTSIIVTLPLNL